MAKIEGHFIPRGVVDALHKNRDEALMRTAVALLKAAFRAKSDHDMIDNKEFQKALVQLIGFRYYLRQLGKFPTLTALQANKNHDGVEGLKALRELMGDAQDRLKRAAKSKDDTQDS